MALSWYSLLLWCCGVETISVKRKSDCQKSSPTQILLEITEDDHLLSLHINDPSQKSSFFFQSIDAWVVPLTDRSVYILVLLSINGWGISIRTWFSYVGFLGFHMACGDAIFVSGGNLLILFIAYVTPCCWVGGFDCLRCRQRWGMMNQEWCVTTAISVSLA